MTMTERERDARTILTIARGYLDRCCDDLPEHLAHELAAIAIDSTTTLTEQTRGEARALLEEAAA